MLHPAGVLNKTMPMSLHSRKQDSRALVNMSTILRGMLGTVLVFALASCDESKQRTVAYDCEETGMMISDRELRWVHLTFRFRDNRGVYRIYEDETTEVVFNRALSTIVWRNSKTNEVLNSRQSTKV